MLKYDHGTFYTHRICSGYKLLLTLGKHLCTDKSCKARPA